MCIRDRSTWGENRISFSKIEVQQSGILTPRVSSIKAHVFQRIKIMSSFAKKAKISAIKNRTAKFADLEIMRKAFKNLICKQGRLGFKMIKMFSENLAIKQRIEVNKGEFINYRLIDLQMLIQITCEQAAPSWYIFCNEPNTEFCDRVSGVYACNRRVRI
eukprot:TRINITY_DN6664_c0_g1_i2.p2 TRINITY_DN6664_c0_g1~~TRINITY_DN6664_c0_g1_i2.p2  ORF type:complete len:179 (-),score=21.70 TRINITY_DN6664_c0_g1_i2:743-1222(-)